MRYIPKETITVVDQSILTPGRLIRIQSQNRIDPLLYFSQSMNELNVIEPRVTRRLSRAPMTMACAALVFLASATAFLQVLYWTWVINKAGLSYN